MDTCITISRTVRGSADSIWAALTCGLAAWQADRVEGDVEVGGHLLLAWPALGAEVDLDVVEVDPRRRLVLSTGATRVTFRIDGSSVELSHSGLSQGDEAEGTRASWTVALGLLDHYLAHHLGRPRHTAWTVARANTTPGAAHVYFTDEAALRTWLTRRGGVGEAGDPVALEMGWGERLTGRVLASESGRDVAISWGERHQSALVLRTLPAPFSQIERLLVATWSCWDHEPDVETVSHLDDAVRRLALVLSRSAEA